MGLSATWFWHQGDWQVSPGTEEPRMQVTVSDSDVAVIRFWPHGSAQGLLYLGLECAEDAGLLSADESSRDQGNDVKAFATWVMGATGRSVKPTVIAEALGDRGASLEAFVEDDVDSLLKLCGIEPPPDNVASH